MNELESLKPDQDERVMAALSNASVIIPLMGLLAPVIIWVTQKDKSPYVAFQSMQAMAYQLSMIFFWFLAMGCYMCSFFLTFFSIPLMPSPDTYPGLAPLSMISFFIPFLVMGVMFLGQFLFIVYGLVGAVMAFQGKPFRYVVIGRWVENFTRKESSTPANP